MNFNSSISYVHVVSDMPINGGNTQEIRAEFSDTAAFTLDEKFSYLGSAYAGSWALDTGDLSSPAAKREKRFFGVVGKATFNFTGTSLAVRISLNPGWGRAYVLIDGQIPSTIAGLSRFKDVITCDSEAHQSAGQEFLDEVVADNLAPGAHKLELICYDNDNQGFFVCSGVKVYSFDNKSFKASRWSLSYAEREQPMELTFETRGGVSATSVRATFDQRLIDPVTRQPLGGMELGTLTDSTKKTVKVLPFLLGTEATGSLPMSVGLSYLMADPVTGDIPIATEVESKYNSAALSYVGGWWVDEPSATQPEYLTANGSRAAWVRFSAAGDSFKIRAYRDYGNAAAKIFKDAIQFSGIRVTIATATVSLPSVAGVSVGMQVIADNFADNVTVLSIAGNVVTLSANATKSTTSATLAFGTYVTTFSTHEENEALQGTFQNSVISGLGSTFNGTVLIRNNEEGKAFGFNTIWRGTQELYSSVTENLVLDFQIKQVPPEPIKSVFLADGRVDFLDPVKNNTDLFSATPFDSRGVLTADVEYRFPSFVCCYVAGNLELFKQYDIVITDPFALTRREVKELQDLGIKVYNYVSFGEEDGTLMNMWDNNSDQGPHKGDGTGPGGSAGYYMKGKYGYGEYSECSFDRQRAEGVKACSKLNSHYYQGVGRCSKSCSKDWRTGYTEHQAGGACGGGYTSANLWKRDASNACSNGACPKYTPMHGGCPQYEQAQGVWGQDFSILDQTAPDENGIWDSFYVDAVKRGPGSWFERLRDYYLPMVFDLPKLITETQVVAQHALSDASLVFGVLMSSAPIDEGEPYHVKDVATGYIYTPNLDYSLNNKIGTVVMSVEPSTTPGAAPAPYVGQVLELSYYKRGLGSDGVFMDTVDTVDVYPEEVYGDGAAGIINDLKALYPDKGFCSNRGFGILPKIIESCSLVMTESVFSDYDFDAKTYQLVDEAGAAWNAEIARMIQELRRTHVFDVVCLNYAPNGPEGDEIRAKVEEQTLELGWLPWLSTILLNDPLPNNRFAIQKGYIRSNDWRRIRVKNL